MAVGPASFFLQLGNELWPEGNTDSGEERVGSTSETLSLEAQIAREMSAMQTPRKQKRFGNENALTLCAILSDQCSVNCPTNTPCGRRLYRLSPPIKISHLFFFASCVHFVQVARRPCPTCCKAY